MFTGIVQGQATLTNKKGNNELTTFSFIFPPGALQDITEGASIAINGTCLTVTDFDIQANRASFDAIQKTLKLTNLGSLKIGQHVNFERAAKFGDEIGGHLMSGHIYASIEITKIIKTHENCQIDFKLSKEMKPYILNKGFVGLNGCSLTIGDVSDEYFSVHLIPETLKRTTFGLLNQGEKVNLELDSQTQAIVNTVENYLKTKNLLPCN